MSNKDDKTNNQSYSDSENDNQKIYLIIAIVSILIMAISALFIILSFKEEEKTKNTTPTSQEEPATTQMNKMEIKMKPKSDSPQPPKQNVLQPPQGFRPQPPQSNIPQSSKIFYSQFSNGNETNMRQESNNTIARMPQNNIPTPNNNQSSLSPKTKNIYSLYKLNELQLSSEIDDYVNGRTNYNGTDKEIQKEFIFIFVRMDYPDLLDKLLTEASEKNILVKDKDFYSDVFDTFENNHTECFQVFAKHGLVGLKDFDKDNVDNKILHMAASKGNTSIVKQALDNGFSIDKRTESNETPLYLAIHNNHYETVEFLINKDALTPKRL